MRNSFKYWMLDDAIVGNFTERPPSPWENKIKYHQSSVWDKPVSVKLTNISWISYFVSPHLQTDNKKRHMRQSQFVSSGVIEFFIQTTAKTVSSWKRRWKIQIRQCTSMVWLYRLLIRKSTVQHLVNSVDYRYGEVIIWLVLIVDRHTFWAVSKLLNLSKTRVACIADTGTEHSENKACLIDKKWNTCDALKYFFNAVDLIHEPYNTVSYA
jgi:hypothetical protein